VSGKRSQKRVLESKRRKKTWKKRLLVLGLVCAALCIFLVPTQFKIWKLEGQLKDYRRQADELQTKKQTILQEIEYYSSDAYVEERARQELGLVKPGEVPIRRAVPGRVQPSPEENQVLAD
jgi:cell division protein FtsB